MVTEQEAIKYLSEVSPDKCFWVNNGPILKKIEDLLNYIPNMSDETFNHHVNKDKNDFSSWINEIVEDKKLANDLLSSKTKNAVTGKLQKRINILRKKAQNYKNI